LFDDDDHGFFPLRKHCRPPAGDASAVDIRCKGDAASSDRRILPEAFTPPLYRKDL